MKMGIIDADLIWRKNQKFPNLACMKLSNYYKMRNNDVKLLLDYKTLTEYDEVFISKVFTDTIIPEGVLNLPNIKYGGTGFFYDIAEPLPNDIEHTFPDYDLYSDFLNEQIKNGKNRKEFEYFLDYSIGLTSRGCNKGCSFLCKQE